MKILVTGSQGQVGASLVQRLKNDAKVELLAVNRAELDITDKPLVDRIVNEFKPNFIINTAAYTAVDNAENDQEKCFAVNRDGPYHLALAANNVGATILHISTDYVFAGDKKNSYQETDITEPSSVYGKSKLAGELAVRTTCERHIILRTAWVFCEHGNNFVKTMMKLATSHKSLNIVADQQGGPTYAGDIAQALILIVKNLEQKSKNLYGTYHYSGYPHINWYEFAREIFAQAYKQRLIVEQPRTNEIGSSDYPTAAKRPFNSTLNCQLIYDTFGIKESNWRHALENLSNYRAEN